MEAIGRQLGGKKIISSMCSSQSGSCDTMRCDGGFSDAEVSKEGERKANRSSDDDVAFPFRPYSVVLWAAFNVHCCVAPATPT